MNDHQTELMTEKDMSEESIALNEPREELISTLQQVLIATLPRVPDEDKKAHAISCACAISRGFLELHIQATASTRSLG